MRKEIKLSKTERQLLLYDIFFHCQVTEYEDIYSRLPISQRMIQRDIIDLADAGLIRVSYSRQAGGYIEAGEAAFDENAVGKRHDHLKRLNRLGRLMRELDNEDVAQWEKEFDDETQERITAKVSYRMLFPGCSERTRQRDFETLCRIGYKVRYDNAEHYYQTDFHEEGLREDFGVFRKDGHLCRIAD